MNEEVRTKITAFQLGDKEAYSTARERPKLASRNRAKTLAETGEGPRHEQHWRYEATYQKHQRLKKQECHVMCEATPAVELNSFFTCFITSEKSQL